MVTQKQTVVALVIVLFAGLFIGYALGYAGAQGDGFFHECPGGSR